MPMRTSCWLALVLAFVAVVAEAQAVAPAPLVPVGGMSAGCPSEWAHRDGGATSFGCRDVVNGAFCNGSYRPAAGAAQADEVAVVRAEIVAMGFVILREGDANGMHELVYDDSAGHRIMQFVRRGPGRVVSVVCGSGRASFDALVPTFEDVASTAR